MLQNRFLPKPKIKCVRKIFVFDTPQHKQTSTTAATMKNITKVPFRNNVRAKPDVKQQALEEIERNIAELEQGVVSTSNEPKTSSSNTSNTNGAACGEKLPPVQGIEIETLDALKEEILTTNKDNMKRFMAGINDHFSKIRQEVSKEFCRLEEVHNQKWEKFLENLNMLCDGETVKLDPNLVEAEALATTELSNKTK